MRQTANGIAVLEVDEIGSTNAEALRLGLAGTPPPLWVRAERQLSGRGRSGRAWSSEPGNLYASLLVRLRCKPTVLHQLSFVAAVAVVAALRHVGAGAAGLDGLRLKWPNDVLVDGAKMVGILPESTLLGDGEALVVIGVGVNLAHAPQGLGRATTCLAALGVDIAPRAMLDALASAMEEALAVWDAGAGFSTIRDRWLRDATPIGTALSVHLVGESIGGTFGGLDTDGALILRDHSGYDRRLTFGDVTLNAAGTPHGNPQ